MAVFEVFPRWKFTRFPTRGSEWLPRWMFVPVDTVVGLFSGRFRSVMSWVALGVA